ncbi:MAG TPA: hypothetical protein VLK84_17495 [Longimicrobium sp.]|nr:hypothetical protein [Longimicrobium sp.]
MSGRAVEILRTHDDAFVPAFVHDSLSRADFVLAERSWSDERTRIHQELLAGDVSRAEWPQSIHWDWTKKAAHLARLEVSGYGLVAESAWQGLMLTKTASQFARLGDDRGKPIVYIDYLEVAPWNWPLSGIGQRPRYRGIGTFLFIQAVRQSFEEEFRGRIGLHSLPQAEDFYRTVLGMTALERDPSKQNLMYFELSREQARLLLEEGGR